MKKLFPVIILFLGSCLSAIAQGPDCKKFKDGSFKIEAKEGVPEVIIVRKGKKQLEKVTGSTQEAEFVVTWINDCTYTLIPTEKTLAMYPSIPKNGVLTVKITEVKPKSYVQTSSSNFTEIVYTSEVIKIE